MDIPAISLFRHSFIDCPCGHSSHIGRGLETVTLIVCEECDAIAGNGVLAVVPGQTAQDLSLNVGMAVRYDRRTMRIVELEQITRLWGRILTPYMRVVMREAA